ncbi:disulfide bond formation protein B [Curvibacter sp. APW13]|uniref:disulfide bond formation protein B n=1 Tax=Curvibacter sp. APW13 TaxID=3077236 RepID=UPI0039658833
MSSRIPVVFYGIALSCAALLVFGLYLQHAVGLEPCPMCIVQRYLLVLVGVFSAMVAFFHGSKSKRIVFLGLMVLAALSGAVVAARQSWLQWYPPEVVSCGRDLYGMIENFPLKRVLPMVFRGSGDCSKIDWTFLGGSIANWSFVTFTLFVLVGALAIGSARGHRERLQ